ncbi:plastocyanin/azurin family copper-binding protein [Aureimonas sp. AU4]|uniref:plastocyanin/azurin family copper-binding protein n=1 Tax=Aureimonas sp. AU4 TaxID=1638163 RepID=UPI000AFB7B5B|nr:plastocyanin/azurin family copper-binding protein [Aureimonas sp. AU4]
MKLHRVVLGAACGALLLSAPAFAAETVSVQLVGERGGQMAIKLDKSEVPAGEVTFQVANVAANTPHEMVVIKLDKPGETLKVDPAKNRVDEKKLMSMGEVSDLKAGQSGKLTVKLAPGAYELICNIKGHVAAGMVAPFTVKG